MKQPTKATISKLLDQGVRWRQGFFRFCAIQDGRDPSSFGILIGRKAYRRAVDRNRIKRLVREAWRLHETDIEPGWNILILPNSGLDLKRLKCQDVEQCLSTALKRRGLIENVQTLSVCAH